jgi:hypothetical protein
MCEENVAGAPAGARASARSVAAGPHGQGDRGGRRLPPGHRPQDAAALGAADNPRRRLRSCPTPGASPSRRSRSRWGSVAGASKGICGWRSRQRRRTAYRSAPASAIRRTLSRRPGGRDRVMPRTYRQPLRTPAKWARPCGSWSCAPVAAVRSSRTSDWRTNRRAALTGFPAPARSLLSAEADQWRRLARRHSTARVLRCPAPGGRGTASRRGRVDRSRSGTHAARRRLRRARGRSIGGSPAGRLGDR